MPKRELKSTEEICNKCKGSGVIINSNKNKMNADSTCTRCGGSGITDWISNAMQNDKYFTFSFDDALLATSATVKAYIDTNAREVVFKDELQKMIVEMMAKAIDEEILNQVTRSMMQAEEQNLKKWIISEGGIIDNGIIS